MSAAAAVLHSRTFSSLRRHRNYRLYFIGQVVSVSGTWMQNTAQAWLVLQLTGSARAVGLLVVFQFAPFAALGLLGGLVSDRIDKRRILLATQSLPILFAGTLAVLAFSHRATVWEVDAIAALNGLVLVLDTPARQAFTVEMVGRRELPNAVALNSSLFNASRIIGPGIAGVLIGTAGTGACFAINALSYVAVVGGLLLMDPDQLHVTSRDTQRRHVIRGLREGLRYARRTPAVRAVLLMMLFVGTISINFNVLLPLVAQRTLDAGAFTYGLLSASFGFGALVGALLSASRGRAEMGVLLAGCAGLGVAELAVAPVHTVWLCALLLAFAGGAFTLYTSNSNSTIQLCVPDRLRGRVLSLYAYVFFGTAPVGGYLAGWLSDRGGTELGFGVAGATALAAALGGGAWWRLAGEPRQRRRRRLPPAEQDAMAVS